MNTGTKWALGILGGLVVTGVILVASAGMWYKGTYNTMVVSSTAVDKALSNMDEAYRRRTDIVPNMVEAVMAETGAESKLDVEYAQARAQMGGRIQLTPEALKDPKAMAAFKSQQGTLGNFLSRIMSVAEKIPNPNFSRSFKDLRVTLDGTNNRIGIAIKDYNEAVTEHNVLVQGFFTRFVAGSNPKFGIREFYKVEEEKKAVPQLKNMNMRPAAAAPNA